MSGANGQQLSRNTMKNTVNATVEAFSASCRVTYMRMGIVIGYVKLFYTSTPWIFILYKQWYL